MGYYTKNGGLIGRGSVSSITGVDDITSVLLRGGARGQAEYTTPGTYTWVAPADVTSVSVVCVGGGGGGGPSSVDASSGGGGGGLGWKNNISVTPGVGYTVVVGAGGNISADGQISYFINSSLVRGSGGNKGNSGTVAGGGGGGYIGDGGGNGGQGGSSTTVDSTNGQSEAGAGGGAGGYSGNGGVGAGTNLFITGATGQGGGGGGGGSPDTGAAGGGGGVGLLGQDTNGNGGVGILGQGGGGSGGGGGGSTPNGGAYGGGGAGSDATTSGTGAPGAVRIIWGYGRSFPSTVTENV